MRHWERKRETKIERKSEKERRVRRGGGGETRLPRMLRDCIATWECNDCTGARLAPTCTHVHTRRSWECADPYQHGKRSLTSHRRPLPLPRTHTRSRDAFSRGTCDTQPKRVARVSKGAKIHNSSSHIHIIIGCVCSGLALIRLQMITVRCSVSGVVQVRHLRRCRLLKDTDGYW